MTAVHQFSTLIELVSYRAKHQPFQTAYTFLEDGHIETGHLTYQQLDKQARAIAAKLQSLKAKGERALLIYPQGLEVIAAFCGCLYAGVIAVPVPPPDTVRLKRTLPRLQAVIEDAQASLILTTSNIKSSVEALLSEIPEFQGVQWLATEEVEVELAQEWEKPDLNCNTLAYLQYTSGSTSVPKGVMISHGNLMHNSACMNQVARYTPDSIITTWLPYFHDYGLVAGIIQPLYACVPCFLMSPLAFIKRPIRWLQAISRYKVTHTGGPTFAYEYCLRRISSEERSTLDLSSLQIVSIGAEPVRQETLENFTKTFSQCGFRESVFEPAYGLAEATLTVTCPHQQANKPLFCSLVAVDLEKNRVNETNPGLLGVRTFAGCGKPISETRVVIVNQQELTQCLPNEVGEIWLSGSSVALGYWNNLEATEQVFGAYVRDTGEGPFLRTGDLGFLKNGELFVTGRLKDLIIIGGTNHYPQDIEMTVEKNYPLIRPDSSAAFSIDVDGQERLVFIGEVESRYREESPQIKGLQANVKDTLEPEDRKYLNAEAAFKAIRQAISEHHELRVYAIVLLKAGSIPKTSSGKIQRSACRTNFLDKKLEIVSEWYESPYMTKLQTLSEKLEIIAQQLAKNQQTLPSLTGT
ncbi:AMP-dependent synthetase [Calothrix sp. HK-06]|nr:AMP-dependent synthetase [Calothrix sp. HK-06]